MRARPQPRAVAADATGTWAAIGCDAVTGAALWAGIQSQARAYRHLMGRTLQVLPRRFGALPADGSSLYRTQSRPGHHDPCGRDDQWSSARFSLGIAADPTLSPHPAYLALGADPAGRATSYRQWLNQGVTGDELHAIRLHVQQKRALGHPRFQAMAARTLNRTACVQPPGRPKKSVTA